MDIYDRLANTVIRLIERYTPNGPNGIWESKQSDIPIGGQEWKRTTQSPIEYPVRILVVPYDLHDWPFLKYKDKSSVPAGNQLAYMAKQVFEPKMNDSVVIGSQRWSIRAEHARIAPETQILLHVLELSQ